MPGREFEFEILPDLALPCCFGLGINHTFIDNYTYYNK